MKFGKIGQYLTVRSGFCTFSLWVYRQYPKLVKKLKNNNLRCDKQLFLRVTKFSILFTRRWESHLCSVSIDKLSWKESCRHSD